MPNLIDQMNILKNLPDQSLAGELSNPTGAVPPYLVLSEVNRRKDMRQRYAGQMAQQAPKTTVVQDQLAALAPPSQGAAAGPGAPMAQGGGFPPGMPTGAPAAPQGIAAAPTGYRHGGVVGYANGGYVLSPDQSVGDAVPDLNAQIDQLYGPTTDAGGVGGSGGVGSALIPPQAATAPAPAPMDLGIAAAPGADDVSALALPAGPDYSGIAAGYQKQLKQEQRARDQAPWLGLMQAGLAIAGGTSPYALENIGKGGAQGLADYSAYMKSADAGTADALKGLSDTQTAQQADEMSRLNAQLDIRKEQQAEDPNSPQNTPQAIREAQLYNNMPENTPEQVAAKQAMLKIIQPFAVQNADAKTEQASQIADAIQAGDQPPVTTGMYGLAPLVKAELAKRGYNMTKANLAYQADLKNVAALNSPAQTRLRQSISQLEPTLDSAQDLADQWNGSGFPPLNKAALVAAQNDPTNPAKQALATNLLAQVDHVTAELGQVYMGGNSPTDAAFKLSGSQLNGDWSKSTFDAAIKQIKENISYRKASLNQAAVYSQSGNTTAPAAVAPAAMSAPNPDGSTTINGVTIQPM